MEESEGRRGWCMILKLVFSGLGIAMGLSAFFIFSFHYSNLEAGLLGLASAVFAAATFHLYLLHRTLRLSRWHSSFSLACLRSLAIPAVFVSAAAMIYYWTVAIIEKEDLGNIGDSKVVDGVWGFMTFKWSMALGISSHKYKKLMDSDGRSKLGSSS